MGVQKDASELLLLFYDKLVREGKENITIKDIMVITKWNVNRSNLAHDYLNDLHLLKSRRLRFYVLTEPFVVSGLSPKGINIVENVQKFKNTFGYEINLDAIKFSWSEIEK